MPQLQNDDARLAALADTATRLAAAYDARLAPDKHVYAALDQAGIKDLAERKRLIRMIKQELHRRKRDEGPSLAPAPEGADLDAVPLSQRFDLLADARRAEAAHPQEDDEEHN